MYIIIYETDCQSRFDAWGRVLRADALQWSRGMGWGARWEAGSGQGTHVHPWLIHVNVGPKPLQYCKVIASLQSLSRVQLFATPWTAAHQASLSITNFLSPPKSMSIELVMASNHLILCHSLLLPSIFSSIRVFKMNQLFTSGGQINEVSASTSVLPMNTQDWSPLGWTGWISLQSKGCLLRTTVKKHQFFGTQVFL